MTNEERDTLRSEVILELRQVEKDLMSFSEARAVLQRRVHEMDGTPRQEIFLSWAMTQVILNSFILAIVRCEGLIQDHHKVLDSLDVPDNVVQLSCVKGDQDVTGGK